ncbi:MAG: FadR/GntR family transcriptional regulator [Clostridia bacterium]|nr:FadR/GntR family transcriptional regulator [Clostridia bacterium]
MFTQINSNKVYTQIIDQIKESIARGELKKGDRLPSERVMSEQLGVSRATVREAIRSLEIMGLVECVQGEGNFIANNLENTLVEPVSMMFILNQGKIREINELRRALELEAIKLATARMAPLGLKKLEELCRIMETSPEEAARAEADKQFHYEIAKASENGLIMNILNAAATLIELQIKDVRQKIFANEKSNDSTNTQHRQVLEAIREKDADKAACAMQTHMDHISKFIEAYKESENH